MADEGWHRGELLGFDLETTGLDRFADVPVSLALVTVTSGVVVDRRVHLVDPGRDIPESVTAIHGITTERARRQGLPLEHAIEVVVDALLAASDRGVALTGVNLAFDLTIIDVQSRRLWGSGLVDQGWTGPVLDALVLDRQFDGPRRGRRTLADLCVEYDVTLGAPHEAAADAEAAVDVTMAMGRRFADLADRSVLELHRAQVAWHEEWMTRFEAWRRSEGLASLDPREFWWPIAPEAVADQRRLGAA
jgi:DNA polymerase-3 subunit epsilon